MNKKKITVWVIVLSLILSMVTGCSGTDEKDQTGADADSGIMDVETPSGEENSGQESDEKTLTEIPICHESGREGIFVIDLPKGYRYDDAWSCYMSDQSGVRMWVNDANLYETGNELENALENAGDISELSIGSFSGWKHEEPSGFYGAETHYYVRLSDYYGDFSGCHVLVTSESGNLQSTQTEEILASLNTIRKKGETVGERKKVSADPVENSVDDITPTETPTDPEENPVDDITPIETVPDPYESLVIDFTPAETAAMSTFMSRGFYAMDGNSVFGQAYTSDGTAELVRIDLVQNGSFAEVDSYIVLEKGITPNYVTVYGDDVYYIHGGGEGGIYKVSKDGGTPQLIIEDAAAYLQIRGDKLYYCDSSYTFREAELDGSNSVPMLDKEVYFPYFVNDQWFIYQDDADNESLHIRHALSGEDITLCSVPGYSPVIYGTDLYFVAFSNGENSLAKIDMKYDLKSPDNFSIEYGDLKEAADITISSEGYLYYGLNNGLSIDRWQYAENPDAEYELVYRYLGEEYEIYWEMDEQNRVSGIYVTLLSESGSQSLPRFD